MLLVAAIAGTASPQPPPANRSWTLTARGSGVCWSRGFGASVSIYAEPQGAFGTVSKARLAVGVPADYDTCDGVLSRYGAVYVYVFDGTSWTFEAKLRPPNQQANDGFGSAVALAPPMPGAGLRLLVGAPSEDRILDVAGNAVGEATDRGASYVFELVGSTWQYVLRIEPELPPSDTGERGQFGRSVALDWDVAVVGAPTYAPGGIAAAGGVWAGHMSSAASSGTTVHRLPALRPPVGFNRPGRALGWSLAVRSRHEAGQLVEHPFGTPQIVAGAPGTGTFPNIPGSVVEWRVDTGADRTVATVHPESPDWAGSTRFGTSVALSPSSYSFVVGAPMRTPAGGASVVYQDGTRADLTPALPELSGQGTQGELGTAVVYREDGQVLLGPANWDEMTWAAPVIAFSPSGQRTWTQAFVLPLPWAFTLGGSGFGSLVSASGDMLAVASPSFPSRSLRPYGQVTVFDLATLDVDLDTLPDAWERQVGLDPGSALGDDGASGDPDHDGLTNAQEHVAQSHPRGFFSRYFAEGSTNGVGSGSFATVYAVAPQGTTPVKASLRLLFSDGSAESRSSEVSPGASWVTDVVGGGRGEFSAIVESDGPIVADREMYWGWVPKVSTSRGAHAEHAIETPAATWHFAEGAAHSGLDTFYLLANPGDVSNTVRATFLLANGPSIEKDLSLPPHSRTTVWANWEEIPAGSGQHPLANCEFGATFASLDALGFIAERAMYLSKTGTPFLGGHASAGATAPSIRWMFAEGATGELFDEFILLANPNPVPARVRLTYLLQDARTFEHVVTVPASARFNGWVNYESFDDGASFPLADVAHSTVVESLDNVGIIAERSMWWPGVGWTEGHNSFGAIETGTAWTSALVRPSTAYNLNQTYLLVANPNEEAVTVRLTLAAEVRDLDGSLGSEDRTWDYRLAPQSRLTIPVHDLDATLTRAIGRAGPASPARVEVLGENPLGVFVEQATYDDQFQAGSCRLLTKIR
jgi:hypothetical protein